MWFLLGFYYGFLVRDCIRYDPKRNYVGVSRYSTRLHGMITFSTNGPPGQRASELRTVPLENLRDLPSRVLSAPTSLFWAGTLFGSILYNQDSSGPGVRMRLPGLQDGSCVSGTPQYGRSCEMY